ncbi:hypothetical protein J6590_066497 [Homalodisca vitripennis]|nr:hypothetical protein J6590_066497 [Homalodisca vitripennis]
MFLLEQRLKSDDVTDLIPGIRSRGSTAHVGEYELMGLGERVIGKVKTLNKTIKYVNVRESTDHVDMIFIGVSRYIRSPVFTEGKITEERRYGIAHGRQVPKSTSDNRLEGEQQHISFLSTRLN